MSEFHVGFVVFPGITQLDFTGPFEVLSRLGTPPSVTVPGRFAQSTTHGVAYLTSVCTGAFLLGAAGLLRGRRATTHWAYVDLLPLVGATHERARVVRDGNVFTAGGVTSGIDFAFRIVTELAGPEVAQAIQLGIDYDPAPRSMPATRTRRRRRHWR